MEDQVSQYTEFIDTLLSKRSAIMRLQQELTDEMEEYNILQRKSKELLGLDPGQRLRTHIEVGENLFVQARVPQENTSTVIVHCGLDVYVEIDTEKVNELCEQRNELLKRKVVSLQEQVEQLTVDIDQVCIYILCFF